jgi:hypothetical protein
MFVSPEGAADAKRDSRSLWSDYRPFGAEENGARHPIPRVVTLVVTHKIRLVLAGCGK